MIARTSQKRAIASAVIDFVLAEYFSISTRRVENLEYVFDDIKQIKMT